LNGSELDFNENNEEQFFTVEFKFDEWNKSFLQLPEAQLNMDLIGESKPTINRRNHLALLIQHFPWHLAWQ
jgi:hypothetical protein